jgi:hypothetical protein
VGPRREPHAASYNADFIGVGNGLLDLFGGQAVDVAEQLRMDCNSAWIARNTDSPRESPSRIALCVAYTGRRNGGVSRPIGTLSSCVSASLLEGSDSTIFSL